MRKAILWVTDERGLKLAEHSVAAALLTQDVSPYLIFCVGFEPPADTELHSAARRLGRVVEYRPLKKREMTEKLHRGKGAHKHVSATAMLKMDALWSLKQEFDRALYVDSDVLLMEDFGLEAVDFEGLAVAAVYDLGKIGELGDDADFHYRCEESGLSPHYFNAGVLAIDLNALSDRHVEAYQNGLVEHFHRCGYNPTCSCNDQCVWNMTFAGAWKRLPLSYNFQACAMFNKGWREAKARHYVGPAKFVPLRKWRNDRRDIALIRKAQVLLGLTPIGKAGLGLTRRLNALRNAAARRKADRAVARVEAMQKAAIDDLLCAPPDAPAGVLLKQ